MDCSKPRLNLRMPKRKPAERARSTRGWGWKSERSDFETRRGGGRVCVQYSRDFIRTFSNRIKYEEIQGCEQCKQVTWVVSLKALVNEDTLLWTYCCPWCFLGCANWETFVADTKCFWTKSETFCVSRTQNSCPQQMLRARVNGKTFVSAAMCLQQCALRDGKGCNIKGYRQSLITPARGFFVTLKLYTSTGSYNRNSNTWFVWKRHDYYFIVEATHSNNKNTDFALH